ncbi:membrane integrity-associated transporter subunit PqiC [Psychromonas sp. 14N.309.X.WAT.B.A12]|uniref:PqiC family protein n=1 Tax=unclassified Psychromonas TaxID=2614957 RepID=UPI0025AFF30F|nr:ABC-type transport auxiliary lipoprotein family protein [Psychromonas sp. 14N.309.X.WAT.B.A12]MDN2664119.1 ABC-type transport auxiliary lipoprotein family protein [Psychromonas sp. 14N.309.X.WAT.B.A12]
MKKWLLILVIFIAGCSSNVEQQNSLFLLPENTTAAIANNSLPMLLVSTNLDTYLDQASLVYRVSDTKIVLAKHNRWAHQISEQINQRMVTNLRTNQGTFWPIERNASIQLTNQPSLQIHFSKFNGVFTGDAELSGEWLLIDGQGNLIKSDNFQINMPLQESGYDQLVFALTQGLNQLSEMITKQISLL